MELFESSPVSAPAPDPVAIVDLHSGSDFAGGSVSLRSILPPPAGQFEVRTARAADSLEIAKIHVRLWTASYQGTVPNSVLEEVTVDRRKLFWDDVLASPSTRQQVLAIDCDGKLTGFVWYSCTVPADESAAQVGADAIYTTYLDPSVPSAMQALAERKVRQRLEEMGFLPVR